MVAATDALTWRYAMTAGGKWMECADAPCRKLARHIKWVTVKPVGEEFPGALVLAFCREHYELEAGDPGIQEDLARVEPG